MVTIRACNPNDLNYIAEVHKECFSNSFISQLNKTLIVDFYRCYFEENSNLFLVAEFDGRIIGFAMGYMVDKSKAQKNFVKRHYKEFLIHYFLLLLKGNKYAWKKNAVIKKNLINSNKNLTLKTEIVADLRYLCILPEFQGCNIATELLLEFEKKMIHEGIFEYKFFVKKDNIQAINFYNKRSYNIFDSSIDTLEYCKKLTK